VLVNDANFPKGQRGLRGPAGVAQHQGRFAGQSAAPRAGTNIVAGALRAHLDWTTVRAGEQTVPITVESSDPDVEALSAKPAELQVTLDRAEGKTLQVQPRIEPALAEGVSLQRVTISPATAAVYGAAQTLTRVSRVQVRLNARSLEVGVEREVQGELVAVDTKGDEVSEVRIFPKRCRCAPRCVKKALHNVRMCRFVCAAPWRPATKLELPAFNRRAFWCVAVARLWRNCHHWLSSSM
jgi:hypothetical protein